MSLRYRISLIVFIVEVVTIAITLQIVLAMSFRASEAQLEQSKHLIVDLISDFSRKSLLAEDYDDLQVLISKARTHSEDIYIQTSIVDINQIIVASSNTSQIGKVWTSSPNEEAIPIEGETGQLGLILITVSDDGLLESFNRIRRIALGVALIGVMIGVLIAQVAGSLLSKRFRELADAVAQIEKGNLNDLSGLTGKDEIGNLAEAFLKISTELSQSLQSMQESEARFRAIFENSQDGMLVAAKGVHKLVNSSYVQMYGYDNQEELIGRPVIELIAPSHQDQISQYIQERGMNPDIPNFYETRVLRKDGTEFDIELHVSTFYLDGELHTLTILCDITDRKEAQESLRASEEQLNAFFDASSAGLTIYNRKLQYVKINEALAAMNGLPIQRHLKRKVSEVLPELAPILEPMIQAVIEEGKSFLNITVSGEVPKEPGVTRYWTVSYFPIKKAEGGVVASGGVVVDITERVRAEQELRKEKSFISRAIDAMTDTFLVIQLSDEHPIRWNKSFREVSGYSDEEISSMKFSDFYLPEELKEQTNEAQWIKEREGWKSYLKTKAGNLIPYEYSGMALDGTEENPISMVIVGRNIREQLEAETTLKQSEKRFRLLSKTLPIAMVITKLEDGTIFFANDKFGKLMNISPSELIGQQTPFLYDSPNGREEMLETFSQTKSLYDYVVCLRKPLTDEPLWVSVTTELMLFEGITSLITVVLDVTEKEIAKEQLQRYAYRLLTQNEIGKAILVAHTPEKIATAALVRLRDMLRLSYASVMLFDFHRDEAIVLAADTGSKHQLSTETRFPLGEIRLEELVRDRLFLREDIRITEKLTDIERLLLAGGIISFLQLPLYNQNELIGAINLGRNAISAFKDDEIEIVREVTDQLAVAIHTARLFEAESQERAMAEALEKTASILAGTLDIDEVFSAILDLASDVVPHDAANIFLLDMETNTAKVIYHKGYTERDLGEWIESLVLEVDNAPNASWLKWSKESVIISDTHNHPSWLVLSEVSGGGWVRSFLGTPIILDDKIIGYLNLDSATVGFFTLEHAIRLRAFADQAASAIRNAQLYDQIQRDAEELSKRVEEQTAELREANIELKNLAQAKDEFVSNVSHELQTPISSLKIRQHLMRLTPDDWEKHLVVIERETTRLQNTIDDLLNLSQIDQDSINLNVTELNLNQLCQQYIDDRQPLAAKKDIRLSYQEQETSCIAFADETLIGQVLNILLTNALNYTPSGGEIQIEVEQIKDQSQDMVGFTMSDTGMGVILDEQEKIFKRFYRGKMARAMREVSGTGLGLSLAYEIIKQHNGMLSVESKGIPGEGTLFRVMLPKVEENENG